MIIITKNEKLDIQKVNNEMIIYSSKHDMIVCLDNIGTLLWELLDTYSDFEDIVDAFYQLFDDKPPLNEFRSDIDEALSSYYRAGLIQIEEKS